MLGIQELLLISLSVLHELSSLGKIVGLKKEGRPGLIIGGAGCLVVRIYLASLWIVVVLCIVGTIFLEGFGGIVFELIVPSFFILSMLEVDEASVITHFACCFLLYLHSNSIDAGV